MKDWFTHNAKKCFDDGGLSFMWGSIVVVLEGDPFYLKAVLYYNCGLLICTPHAKKKHWGHLGNPAKTLHKIHIPQPEILPRFTPLLTPGIQAAQARNGWSAACLGWGKTTVSKQQHFPKQHNKNVPAITLRVCLTLWFSVYNSWPLLAVFMQWECRSAVVNFCWCCCWLFRSNLESELSLTDGKIGSVQQTDIIPIFSHFWKSTIHVCDPPLQFHINVIWFSDWNAWFKKLLIWPLLPWKLLHFQQWGHCVWAGQNQCRNSVLTGPLLKAWRDGAAVVTKGNVFQLPATLYLYSVHFTDSFRISHRKFRLLSIGIVSSNNAELPILPAS